MSHLGLLEIALNFIDTQRSKALLYCNISVFQPFPHGLPLHGRFYRGLVRCTDED